MTRIVATFLTIDATSTMLSTIKNTKKESISRNICISDLKAIFETKILIIIAIFRALSNQEIWLIFESQFASFTLIVQRELSEKSVEVQTFLKQNSSE